MKISLNWLKSYVQTDLPVETIAEILTNIGLEVEGQETIQSIKGGLDGLVVGEVLSCVKHPNADSLSLTTVNIGDETPLQIVCGAPNVAAGQKVIVATVGAMLYPADGEPFKIKKGKIRGETSEGMICAEDEIGLGNSHSGIMVLDTNATAGMPARDYINSIGGYKGKKVEVDTIIEIGLTPNRSDATGHLGVAFDLAAAMQINYPGEGTFQKPDITRFSLQSTELPIEVVVEDEARCPRYSGLCIKGVKVAESPQWLKTRLEAIGLSPINNIVDITNFVLHELGQPLHAFDYDKIEGHQVRVKTLAEGTKFLCLDEVERELHEEDLMICNANSKGMCIAGVFGGLHSGVANETVNIFLESAHFHPKSTRRTSMRHLLRTDAASCFEKGTDPNITIFALKRAALLIQEIAGGTIASDIIDIYPNPVARPQVVLKYKNITRLIGKELSKEEIHKILWVLDMPISDETEIGCTVAVPTNKSDVLREVDVIEEILRIYGYNLVEAPETLHSVLSFQPKPDPMKLRGRVSEWLAALGFNEMMALSLTKSSYYQDLYPIAKEELVFVNNTSNQQLDLMRPTMLLGGLEAVLHNQNRQTSDLFLYEFGKTYRSKGEKYIENQFLSLIVSGQRLPESWLNPTKAKAGFYTLKAYVETVFAKLGIDLQNPRIQSTVIEGEKPWAYAISLYDKSINKELLTMGRVHPELTYELDIKNSVFYAEINWDAVLMLMGRQKIQYQPLPKFPTMRRDLALVVDKTVSFEQILNIARRQGKKLLKDTNLFDVYENEEHLGEGKKSYAVSFLFLDENKTLKDSDVDSVMDKLMQNYEKELNALIRK